MSMGIKTGPAKRQIEVERGLEAPLTTTADSPALSCAPFRLGTPAASVGLRILVYGR